MVMEHPLSDFDRIQYQDQAFQELTHIIQAKKIPNALLFSGNKNTGRKEAAFFFAKACNCRNKEKPACNRCESCRKIEAESHPDILVIKQPEGKKTITISQVRELGRILSSRPNEAIFRMVLISGADLMNTQAQNSLLKMLEEPPEKTFFILLAEKITALLPTILSRCRKLRFKPMTSRHMEDYLVNKFNVDRKMARIASGTADTDLEKALMYLNMDEASNDIDWIRKRKWLLNTLTDIIQKERKNSITKGLMLSRRLSLSPDHMGDVIAVMKTFFRDLIIFGHYPEKTINSDFLDRFAEIHQMKAMTIFFKWLNNLFELEKRLDANSSLRLSLDRFLLGIIYN